jgi:hypothetical protein
MQISTFVIVFLLSVNLAIAQDESSPGQDAKLGVDQKIEQKLKMEWSTISYIALTCCSG